MKINKQNFDFKIVQIIPEKVSKYNNKLKRSYLFVFKNLHLLLKFIQFRTVTFSLNL